MSTTATKRNVNFANVTFTPSGGGTAITYTGIVDIKKSAGGKLIKFRGDNDLFPTSVVPDGSDPSVALTCADLAACEALPIGTVGTFTYTQLDARNRTPTGAGSMVVTAALAMIEDVDTGGQFAQFGMGQVKITGVSADGQTNPWVTTIQPGT